jgi:hypothetical protein
MARFLGREWLPGAHELIAHAAEQVRKGKRPPEKIWERTGEVFRELWESQAVWEDGSEPVAFEIHVSNVRRLLEAVYNHVRKAPTSPMMRVDIPALPPIDHLERGGEWVARTWLEQAAGLAAWRAGRAAVPAGAGAEASAVWDELARLHDDCLRLVQEIDWVRSGFRNATRLPADNRLLDRCRVQFTAVMEAARGRSTAAPAPGGTVQEGPSRPGDVAELEKILAANLDWPPWVLAGSSRAADAPGLVACVADAFEKTRYRDEPAATARRGRELADARGLLAAVVVTATAERPEVDRREAQRLADSLGAAPQAVSRVEPQALKGPQPAASPPRLAAAWPGWSTPPARPVSRNRWLAKAPLDEAKLSWEDPDPNQDATKQGVELLRVDSPAGKRGSGVLVLRLPSRLPPFMAEWLRLPPPPPEWKHAEGNPLPRWHRRAIELAWEPDCAEMEAEIYRAEFSAWAVTTGAGWFNSFAAEASDAPDSPAAAWLKALGDSHWCRLVPKKQGPDRYCWPALLPTGAARQVAWEFDDFVSKGVLIGKPTWFAAGPETAQGTFSLGRREEALALAAAVDAREAASHLERTDLHAACLRLEAETRDAYLGGRLVDRPNVLAWSTLKCVPAVARHRDLAGQLDGVLAALRSWCEVHGLRVTPTQWRPLAAADALAELPARFSNEVDRGGIDVAQLGLEWISGPEGGAETVIQPAKVYRSAGPEPEGWSDLHRALRNWNSPAAPRLIKELESWPAALLDDRDRAAEILESKAVIFFDDLWSERDTTTNDGGGPVAAALDALLEARKFIVVHPISATDPSYDDVERRGPPGASRFRREIRPYVRDASGRRRFKAIVEVY